MRCSAYAIPPAEAPLGLQSKPRFLRVQRLREVSAEAVRLRAGLVDVSTQCLSGVAPEGFPLTSKQHRTRSYRSQHLVTLLPTNSLSRLSSALHTSGWSAVAAARGQPWLWMR